MTEQSERRLPSWAPRILHPHDALKHEDKERLERERIAALKSSGGE